LPHNFAALILRHAQSSPDLRAIIRPSAWTSANVLESESVTFAELSDEAASYRAGFVAEGFVPGDRVILMFPVSLQLYSLVLGLLSGGMVVVLIDAGMGRKKITQAIADSGAVAIVSVNALLRYRWLLPSLWKLRMYSLDSSGFCMKRAGRLRRETRSASPLADRSPVDHALITFTSGSTGRPKGADRTHGLLTAQHEALSQHFPHAADEIDMPCFPVVTLHNLCCGITTVLPPVDFGAVADVEPGALWSWAETQQVTRMSGAPAYMEPLIAALEAGQAAPQTLRTLGVGGGRVPTGLCRRSLAVLPGRACKVLYGSTEAEPISSASFEEVVAAEGEGVLVGHVAQQAEVAIVQLPDELVILDDRGLGPYLTEHGELLVRGPHVNRNYVDNEEADRANKLATQGGSVWHRTGDVGWRDAQGRLWLTGRVTDLVTVDGRVVHPFPVEQAAEQVVGLRRAALIDTGGPHFVVEPQHAANKSALEAAVRHFLAQRDLAELPIVLVEQIPMDRRHHSKIDRPALRATLSAKQ